MPFDPKNDAQVKNLRDAVDWSRGKLRPFRKFRAEARRAWTANNYGEAIEDDTADRTAVNELGKMISVLLPLLAAQNPRVLVTTMFRDLEPTADEFGQKVNRDLAEIDLVVSLREVLLEAIFVMGVVRVGITEDSRSSNRIDREEIYVEPISLNDFVVDMTARSLRQADYMGNRYVLPLEMVADSGLYDKKWVDKLVKRSLAAHEDGVERDEELTRGTGFGVEYVPKVELWDYWLPAENLIVTMADQGPTEVGRVVSFDGPEEGPYRILSFGQVPGSVMPLSPAMQGMDLHYASRALHNKIIRQAERQKEVPWFKGEAEQDMTRLMGAADSEVKRIDNPGAIGSYKTGGANPQTIAMAMHLAKVFSQRMGNLDVVGGINVQADTATQETLLAGNADKRIQDMQKTFHRFTKSIVQGIAWYEWTDERRADVVTTDVGPFRLMQLWAAETREGDFVQYDVDIEPFSMQQHSPATRLAQLMQLWPMLLQSRQEFINERKMPSAAEFFEVVMQYADLPELKRIIKDFNPETRPEIMRANAEPQKSPVTSRTNTRVNAGSGQDSDDATIQRLMNSSGAAA